MPANQILVKSPSKQGNYARCQGNMVHWVSREVCEVDITLPPPTQKPLSTPTPTLNYSR